MEENRLPIEELKEYGIMNEDNSFSKKLSEKDVKKFLDGYVIVADYQKDRITFQLDKNNTELKVNMYERDKRIQDILENSKEKIQYSKKEPINTAQSEKDKEYNMKVFVAQKENEKTEVKEYDLFKDTKELTKVVAERKEESEINTYKIELLKLKGFLQDKIDKYPELAKQLTENINIISNEIDRVNSISVELNKKAGQSKVELDVNDPDMYEDANREREEQEEIEQKEEIKRGRKH